MKTIDQRVVDDAPRETSVRNDAHDAAIEPDAYAFEMVDANAQRRRAPRARRQMVNHRSRFALRAAIRAHVL